MNRGKPHWSWWIVTLALLIGFGYLRFVVFPDRFVPLASGLILLPALWHRDLRILWGASTIAILMGLVKAGFVMPQIAPDIEYRWLFATMQMMNSLIPAIVIHMVIVASRRVELAKAALELSNTELEASNEELASREEEIASQNEELQSQAEELEQQNEEIKTQTEELYTLNEQLTMRERTLSDLFEKSSEGVSETEAMAKLGQMVERMIGDRMVGAAVLEACGDDMIVHGLCGLPVGPHSVQRNRTLAALVLDRQRAGSLADISLRPDIEAPTLPNHRQVRSLAAAPFRIAGDWTGALEVYSSATGEWSDHELRIVKWLADQCGLMWTTARLWEERERLLASERVARSEADRANRMKDEFVATLSHELRTPLNAVLGWASLLKKADFKKLDEVKNGIDVIERNARHQNQLISDLLDITRITSGKTRLDVQTVDLPLLIENALESVRPAAEAKGVQLHKSLSPVDRTVIGDPTRLQQILWNLLSNAIKFTRRDGSVLVSVAARADSHVQIAVSDTGEGISPELLPYIFDRYRQADGSATRRHGGLGLGLAITRSLVELHGGSIQVQSDGVNKGATFTVLLPVRVVNVRDAKDANSARDGRANALPLPVESLQASDGKAPSLNDLSILVVDDEGDARDIVARILRGHGAVVTEADSGDNALKAIDRAEFDLIISDLGMPLLDGYGFIRAVRARTDQRRKIPAIALTAFAQSQDRTRALLSGFQAHIAKPAEASELVATVASLRWAAAKDGNR